MTSKTLYLTVAVLLVAVIIGIFLTQGSKDDSQSVKSQDSSAGPVGEQVAPSPVPEATGSPDDAVNAFVMDAQAESDSIELEDNSSAILESDDADLDSFSQSANNYDF